MFKALTAAAAITVCCLGNEYPASAQYCSGLTNNYSSSGTCSDGSGGSYSYSGSGSSRRLVGTTGGGEWVDVNVDSDGGFRGSIGDQFVTCDRWGSCY